MDSSGQERDTTAHVYKRGEGSVMILGYISAIGVEGQKSIEWWT